MAKAKIRLPPKTIRAIENVVSEGGEARVKLDHGTFKVQKVTVRLVSAREA